MRNFVIGTAGHIDHGKTAIVEKLSGVNTDTLQEEQKRGITVNLGFTYFKLQNKEVGIIDVPGHEKLIKNMLAGVFGIDLVLLVIAADDGIMPQTREHYEIIQFLGIKNVLVVVSKTDLVESERVEEVKLEVQDEFGLTEFAEFSIYDDISSLVEKIDSMLIETNSAKESEQFRMPIDRVFTVKGVGTIVTGTSLTGNVHVGDTLEVYPGKETVKVKGIQVHKKPIQMAEKHMRVALNINKVDLRRGKVIATPNSLQPTKILDCKLTMGKNTKENLKHLESVKFYYFSEETNARVKLFNQKFVSPGESVFCQLLLESELYATKKDVAVIRKINPAITIAGVEILNEQGEFANRKDLDYQKNIKLYSEDETTSLLVNYLHSKTLVHMEDLRKREFDINEVSAAEYVKVETYYIHNDNLDKLHKLTIDTLTKFHKQHKYVNGMNKQELKSKLGIEVKSRILNGILDLFDEVYYKDYVKLKSFEISLTEDELKMKKRIIDYLGNTFKPPKYNEVYLYFQSKDFENVFFSLLKKGEMIKIDDDIYLHKDQFEKLLSIVRKFIEQNKYLEITDARSILDTSRRYAVPYLEYLDKQGYTIRKEKGRIWRK